MVGVGTKFMSELRPGNSIIVTGETRTVATITDDTHLTVTSAFSNGANDTSPDKSFALAHPVNPIEVQGKIFVIHEDAGRMIHYDGNDYQIGITAPTTLPSTSLTYGTVNGLSDGLTYANSGAFDAAWTDGDVGTGVSEWSTSDPDSTQGPKGVSKYIKFYFGAAGATNVAKRTAVTVGGIGDKFSIDIPVYIDAIGTKAGEMDFNVCVYNANFKTLIVFDGNGVYVADVGGYKTLSTNLQVNKWQSWKFVIDGTDSVNPTIATYLDGVQQIPSGTTKTVTKTLKEPWASMKGKQLAQALEHAKIKGINVYNTTTTSSASSGEANPSFSNSDTTADGVVLYARGKSSTAATPMIWVDSIVVAGESGTVANLEGTHRYAITYARSGNYGCESNPIKSIVGSATLTGSGLNDMTVSSMSSYTGSSTKTFRVQIDGTGTPNTIKWSDDAGATWKTTTLAISTTMYLSYGLIILFGATTGHTNGDYWSFTATACAGSPTKQTFTLSSIPTSSDGQVNQRKIYRTTSGGSQFYWLATINDNTTATFVDNIPDLELGEEMEEDHDIAPNGKFSTWWDNCLWIAQDDIVYYSQYGFPEHFHLASRYITVEKGDPNDIITGLIAFKDSLYVFRKKSIYVIQANSYGYGIYLVENHTGCRAPWSIVEVNNNLVFISDRGIEVFNGTDCYPMALSDKIERTMRTIDASKYDYISATLVRDKYEVWFSIPDRTSGSAITVVYNYIYNQFYYFTFYKTPSCLVTAENSSGTLVTKMGTRDGYLCLCESTYRDNTTAITATYRKGWTGEWNSYANIRRLDVVYELPTSMTLTANLYVNFDKDGCQRRIP